MTDGYEINDMAKEESWRIFRIMGEMVEGFDKSFRCRAGCNDLWFR